MNAWPINPPSSGTLAFSLRLAPYCRSCPCDRHDLISPLTFYLIFLGAIWTYGKKLAPIFPYLPPTLPHFTRAPRPPYPWLIPNSLGPPPTPLLLTSSSDRIRSYLARTDRLGHCVRASRCRCQVSIFTPSSWFAALGPSVRKLLPSLIMMKQKMEQETNVQSIKAAQMRILLSNNSTPKLILRVS